MSTIQPARQMRSHPKMKFGLQIITQLLPNDIIGVEIGSYAGESAEIFAASGKFKKFICVDMWDPGYYSGKQLISAEQQFDQVAAKYPCIEKRKMDCNDLLQLNEFIPAIDFVYIDGNHNYNQVIKDIQRSIILMKNSSVKILAGHDYDYKKSPGVKPAITELLGYPDAIFCDYSWIKFLRPEQTLNS